MTEPGRQTSLRRHLEDLARDVPTDLDLVGPSLARADTRRRRRVALVSVSAFLLVLAAINGFALARSGSGNVSVAVSAGGAGPPSSVGPSSSVGPAAAAGLPQVLGTVSRATVFVWRGLDGYAMDPAGKPHLVLRLPGAADQGTDAVVANSGSLSADGTRLALPSQDFADTGSGGSTTSASSTGVWVLDLPTGHNRLYGMRGQPTMAASWAPDGSRLWAARWGGGGVYVLDLANGKVTVPAGITDVPVYWAADSRHLLVSQGGWRIVDLTGRTVRTLPRLASWTVRNNGWMPAEWAGLSPDGRWLALESSGTTGLGVTVIDVDTGQPIRTFDAFPLGWANTQNIIGWSGDHQIIYMRQSASGRHDATPLTLDVNSGRTSTGATIPDADGLYVPVAGGR